MPRSTWAIGRRPSARGSSRPSRGSTAPRGAAPARRRERVDELGERLGAVLARRADLARGRLAEAERRRPRPRRSARSPTARAISSAPRPRSSVCVEVELVERRRPPARSAARRPPAPERSGSSSHARTSRRCASSWRPSQCSTAAQSAVSSTRRASASAGSSSIASSSVARQRSSSPSDRCADASATRTSTWRSWSAAGQQAQRRLEPARRGGRARAPRSAAGRAAAARSPASSPWAADRSTWWASSVGAAPRAAERAPRRGRARPAASRRRRLVDRAAHERMAEAEAARHGGRAHQVAREQRVERVERPRRVDSSRDRRREVGLERLARDRGAVEQRPLGSAPARPSSSASDAATAAAGCRRVAAVAGRRHAGRAGARELLEVERVAAAVAVDRRAARVSSAAEQLGGLRLAELLERDPRAPPAPRARRPAAPAPGRAGTASASSTGASGPRRSSAAISSIDAASLQCRSSSTSTSGRSSAQHARAARAPRGARGSARRRPRLRGVARAAQRRQDLRRARRQVVATARAEVELLRGDVGVERVGPHAERHVALELRGRPGEHEAPALLGAVAQLASRRVLPIPGSPSIDDAARRRRRRARRAPPSSCSSSRSRPTVGRALESMATLARAYPVRRFRGPVQGPSPMFAGPHADRLPVMPCTPPRGPHAAVTQHRSARRALERPAPQDGHHRLDRLRRPRLRHRRQDRHRHSSRRPSPASASPAAPTRIVDGAYPESVDEMVLDPEQQAEDRRSRVPRRGRRRQPAAGARSTASTRSPGPYGKDRQAAVSPDDDAVAAQLPDPRRRDRGRRGAGQRDVDATVAAVDAAREGAPRPAHRAVGRRQLRGRVPWRSSTPT